MFEALITTLAVVAALVIGAIAVYLGMFLFTRLSRNGLDVQAELRRGNMAAGISLAGAIFATAVMVQGGLFGLVNAVSFGRPWEVAALQILVGFVLSIVVVNGGSRIFDWATPGTLLFPEIRRGNNAMAIGHSISIVALAWVVSTALTVISW